MREVDMMRREVVTHRLGLLVEDRLGLTTVTALLSYTGVSALIIAFDIASPVRRRIYRNGYDV